MERFPDPSKVPEPAKSLDNCICLGFASLDAVAALPITVAVIEPALKLPSASLTTRVFAVLATDSIGRS